MQTLPLELILQICNSLPKQDILSLRLTCKKLAKGCEELAFAELEIMSTSAGLHRLGYIAHSRFGCYVKMIEFNTLYLDVIDATRRDEYMARAVEKARAKGQHLCRMRPTKQQEDEYLNKIIADQHQVSEGPALRLLLRSALAGLKFLTGVRLHSWCFSTYEDVSGREWPVVHDRSVKPDELAFPEILSLALPSPNDVLTSMGESDRDFNAAMLSNVVDAIRYRANQHRQTPITLLDSSVISQGLRLGQVEMSSIPLDHHSLQPKTIYPVLRSLRELSLYVALDEGNRSLSYAHLISALEFMKDLRQLRLATCGKSERRPRILADFLASHVWPLLASADICFEIESTQLVSFAQNHAGTLTSLLLNEMGIKRYLQGKSLNDIAMQLPHTHLVSSWSPMSRVEPLSIHLIHGPSSDAQPFDWNISFDTRPECGSISWQSTKDKRA